MCSRESMLERWWNFDSSTRIRTITSTPNSQLLIHYVRPEQTDQWCQNAYAKIHWTSWRWIHRDSDLSTNNELDLDLEFIACPPQPYHILPTSYLQLRRLRGYLLTSLFIPSYNSGWLDLPFRRIFEPRDDFLCPHCFFCVLFSFCVDLSEGIFLPLII